MREVSYRVKSGLPFLILAIALFLGALVLFIRTVYLGDHNLIGNRELAIRLISVALTILAGVLTVRGLFVLQPNEARVFLLFGKYVGTSRREGFGWVNPFFTKKKISLRLRNMNGDRLKVNDQAGNPIEIALVLVWRVEDTYAACFEVDDYADYVGIQSESALRHLATAYPYDSWEDDAAVTLRGDIDQVSAALEKELQERLDRAGVKVQEARLSHLAYAPEIAEAMLRRQQASAIVAARSKIVEGAVGMVQMALERLKRENIIDLDDERRAAMVSNLLVVLCGETNAQPVVNAGTLYH
jgi:hypothetical protein